MERVIKFRGQCKISKEMVFGDLIHGVSYEEGQVFILPNKHNLAYVKHCDPLNGVRVIPGTVGQFSGLTDRNGKEACDDDIVRDNVGRVWILTYSKSTLSYHFEYAKDRKQKQDFKRFNEHQRPLEIIGNIHENSELITP